MPWRYFASRFSALPSLCDESRNCSVARPRNALPLLCSAICAIPMPSNSVHRFAVAMLCSAFPPHCLYCAKERGAIPSRFNVKHIDSALFLLRLDTMPNLAVAFSAITIALLRFASAMPLLCYAPQCRSHAILTFAPLCLRLSMPSNAFPCPCRTKLRSAYPLLNIS